MCGIAGFYNLKNTYQEKDLKRMTSLLSRRGPDAEGFFYDAPVGLGHRRLSVLDLSTSANQPMRSQDGRYTVVFNGEIYNYKELASKWSLQLKTTSDTEVLLEAFARFGPDVVNEFNGMFSFAIYDSLEGTLFVFRDRLGIKPLCYSFSSEGFVFASEIKALIGIGIDKTLDTDSLKDYFFLEYIPSGNSIFKHIKKLNPGHYIKISRNEFQLVKYYDVIDQYNPMHGVGEEKLLGLLEQNLIRSINYQSISDVPLGAFLSGGTDSSLICAIFQNQFKNPINTFTIGFDVKKFDESKYAQSVAEALGTNHQCEIISSDVVLSDIESLPGFYDEPFAVPSVIPSLRVCKEARKLVTVALSGDGGDELFMGYGYYNWYKRVELVNRIGGRWSRKISSELLSHFSQESAQKASRIFDYSNSAVMWPHVWSQEQYMFSEKEISALFARNYNHTTIVESWEDIDRLKISPFEKISLFDIKNYLPHNLLYKMDIASMSHGLEVRVPYLDHNFVEFAINVPVEYKVKNGQAKYLMKKLLERYIPKELIYRKKWGFPAPVGNWLKGDLGILLDKYLNKKVLEKQGIFNSDFVCNYVNDFRNGNAYHYKRIWSLLYFQLWYKTYIDESLTNE